MNLVLRDVQRDEKMMRRLSRKIPHLELVARIFYRDYFELGKYVNYVKNMLSIYFISECKKNDFFGPMLLNSVIHTWLSLPHR